MPKHKPAPWLKAKKPTRAANVGATWYTENEWRAVKAAAVDPERFEDTYAAWVAMAETSMSELLAAGVVTEPVNIVAAELLAWCLVHDKPNIAASRSAFVAHLLRKHSAGAAKPVAQVGAQRRAVSPAWPSCLSSATRASLHTAGRNLAPSLGRE